jgi:hypothetical protein
MMHSGRVLLIVMIMGGFFYAIYLTVKKVSDEPLVLTYVCTTGLCYLSNAWSIAVAWILPCIPLVGLLIMGHSTGSGARGICLVLFCGTRQFLLSLVDGVYVFNELFLVTVVGVAIGMLLYSTMQYQQPRYHPVANEHTMNEPQHTPVTALSSPTPLAIDTAPPSPERDINLDDTHDPEHKDNAITVHTMPPKPSSHAIVDLDAADRADEDSTNNSTLHNNNVWPYPHYPTIAVVLIAFTIIWHIIEIGTSKPVNEYSNWSNAAVALSIVFCDIIATVIVVLMATIIDSDRLQKYTLAFEALICLGHMFSLVSAATAPQV